MALRDLVTVRMPVALKQRLIERARREHRSLSGQVIADLEIVLARSAAPSPRTRLLGMFSDRVASGRGRPRLLTSPWAASIARTIRQFDRWDREDSSSTPPGSGGSLKHRRGKLNP